MPAARLSGAAAASHRALIASTLVALMPTLTALASLSVIVILALARDTGLLNDGIDRYVRTTNAEVAKKKAPIEIGARTG